MPHPPTRLDSQSKPKQEALAGHPTAKQITGSGEFSERVFFGEIALLGRFYLDHGLAISYILTKIPNSGCWTQGATDRI